MDDGGQGVGREVALAAAGVEVAIRLAFEGG